MALPFEGLRELIIDTAREVFGVSATVTRPAPDNMPIDTTGFWLTEEDEKEPFGQVGRRQPRKVFVLAKSVVPTIPRGTVIVAAELIGGSAVSWTVDRLASVAAPDHWRVVVERTN